MCVCVCLSQCILCNNNLCELFSAKGNKGGAAGRAARASSSSASSSHNLESQVENVPANWMRKQQKSLPHPHCTVGVCSWLPNRSVVKLISALRGQCTEGMPDRLLFSMLDAATPFWGWKWYCVAVSLHFNLENIVCTYFVFCACAKRMQEWDGLLPPLKNKHRPPLFPSVRSSRLGFRQLINVNFKSIKNSLHRWEKKKTTENSHNKSESILNK